MKFPLVLYCTLLLVPSPTLPQTSPIRPTRSGNGGLPMATRQAQQASFNIEQHQRLVCITEKPPSRNFAKPGCR